MPVIPAIWEADIRTITVQGQARQKHKTLSEKLKAKRAGGMGQMVENLPSLEVNSIPSTDKDK
jgi:hypothetical protein